MYEAALMILCSVLFFVSGGLVWLERRGAHRINVQMTTLNVRFAEIQRLENVDETNRAEIRRLTKENGDLEIALYDATVFKEGFVALVASLEACSVKNQLKGILFLASGGGVEIGTRKFEFQRDPTGKTIVGLVLMAKSDPNARPVLIMGG